MCRQTASDGDGILFKRFTMNPLSRINNQVIKYDLNNYTKINNNNNMFLGFKGKLNWDLRDFESREDKVFSYSIMAGGLCALGIYGYFALTVSTLSFGALAFGAAIIVGGFIAGFIIAYIILDEVIPQE